MVGEKFESCTSQIPRNASKLSRYVEIKARGGSDPKFRIFLILVQNFVVIPPWLEKNLNLAPLKCLEMLPNCPDMWKLSD